MGLLQAAYKTYGTLDRIYGAGVSIEGKKALTPVSHFFKNADIEITINLGGSFVSAVKVDKNDNETLIPVTEESANRTSGFAPHPLAEQLGVLSGIDADKTKQYLDALAAWVESDYTHEKAKAVFEYVRSGTIISDLEKAGLTKLTAKDNMVRWSVIPSEVPECHKDTELMACYQSYFQRKNFSGEKVFCMITGDMAEPAVSHPKDVVKSTFNAKLISTEDTCGFKYIGRFRNADDALSIGYEASQKAHSALRFLVANHGVRIGNRTFLCWNPDGKTVPRAKFFDFDIPFNDMEEEVTFNDYKKELHNSLWGKENELKLGEEDDVIIASFEAATPGRLSTTYYNELSGRDFLQRVEDWYESLCVVNYNKVQTPSLVRMIKCAFGNQREKSIEVDDRILGENVSLLFHCMIDKQPIPFNIVKALTDKCGRLYLYKNSGKPNSRNILLTTACAVIRKYHNDKSNREEWKLALDVNNKNRSYLFGRLLAIAEKVERDTYQSEEGREPNAMRMQSVFAQRPMYAWRILEEQLRPYYSRLRPGTRQYYKKLIQEITDSLSSSDEELNRKLDDVYLLGYYHQRALLYTKKENTGDNEADEINE